VHEVVKVVVLGFKALGDAQCFVELGRKIAEEVATLEAFQIKARHRGKDVVVALIVEEGVIALAVAPGHFDSANLCAVGLCAHLTLLDQVEQVLLWLTASSDKELRNSPLVPILSKRGHLRPVISEIDVKRCL
jgi:hypothetical protein